MKQLVQKLKDGEMGIVDVPVPVITSGMVLVQNYHSLISAGTEGSTVRTARKSLVGKAKERPQQVKQVIDTLKQQGPVQTYRAVMKKLDSYSPLGYSSAGKVIGVAQDVSGLAVGDLVACAGAGYANHAEVVAVPVNLCVKLPADADTGMAAYNTLGAIALQGIRQADPKMGETCIVIGLGLLGQLTCLMLRASGVKVVGLDIDERMVKLAADHCADEALSMSAPDVNDVVERMTGGIGADSAIITAATTSLDPVNLAGQLLRKRGTVVIVGSVPTGFDREPYFYKKELSLKMSCSYGPGRYDLNYEEKGQDYPAGLVRWTENRNMKAFQELISAGKIDLSYLTTHRYKLDDAVSAYNIIVSKTEDFIGILLEYDAHKEIVREKILVNTASTSSAESSQLGISFIGAGSYAMGNLLPNIQVSGDVALRGVITSSGTSARTVAEKYGFQYCAADEVDILGETETNTIFIATRHNTHFMFVKKALESGKHVFVEKPLCMTENELHEITDAYQGLIDSGCQRVLMVGFNRRFAPLAEQMKASLGSGAMSMLYRINAGCIPADSWIQDAEIGGGRIIGEVCHFIDFMTYMNGSLPCKVHAVSMLDPSNLDDTLNISLGFENGSIGTISYYANGSKALAKEYVEVYRGGKTAILNDFKELKVYSKGKPIKKKMLNQDKGQKVMVHAFLDACMGRSTIPVPFAETRAATMATFRVLGSLRTGEALPIG